MASTTGRCAARSRSARRSTTRCSPGRLNGEPLLPDHGYPLRLVLPGWVGIGSIKWLGSLEVSRTELTSPWNTKWYRMTGGDYPADSPPLTVNPVRSAWELPWNAAFDADADVELHRSVLERGGIDPPRRRQRRRRRHLDAGPDRAAAPAAGLDPVVLDLGPAGRGRRTS